MSPNPVVSFAKSDYTVIEGSDERVILQLDRYGDTSKPISLIISTHQGTAHGIVING